MKQQGGRVTRLSAEGTIVTNKRYRSGPPVPTPSVTELLSFSSQRSCLRLKYIFPRYMREWQSSTTPKTELSCLRSRM
ncbi:hypothetical protein VTK73DRAFT_9960 [Phialemonium thermophilum]|uniref:Uncharacterized protein n=1 Tax=Phialemonium thermophilum TaxID=223376 RepID=A0ABR3XIW7_9PEZI